MSKIFYPSRNPVHVRQTEIKTYNLGDHQVLVEATLKDTRTPRPGEDSSAAEMVLVHDLVARIRVQGPDLTIAAAEAEMPHVPREGCRVALPDMQKLVPLFQRRVGQSPRVIGPRQPTLMRQPGWARREASLRSLRGQRSWISWSKIWTGRPRLSRAGVVPPRTVARVSRSQSG